MKLTPIHLIILTVVVMTVGYVALKQAGMLQCTACGAEWTYIGRQQVSPGGIVDVTSLVKTYNSQIQSASKTVAGITKYDNCQIPVIKIERYSQGGTYYTDIYQTAGSSLMQPEFDPTNIYTCPNAVIAVKVSPLNCNHDYTTDTAKQNYETCSAVSLDISIPSKDVQDVECTAPDTQQKTCWDGSTITQSTCTNNQWVLTGQQCPPKPIVNTDTDCGSAHINCASTGKSCSVVGGYGTCVSQANVCTNTCSPGQTRASYPSCLCSGCPTYTGAQCAADEQPTYNTAGCQAGCQKKAVDYTWYIAGGAVIILGAVWYFTGKRRK